MDIPQPKLHYTVYFYISIIRCYPVVVSENVISNVINTTPYTIYTLKRWAIHPVRFSPSRGEKSKGLPNYNPHL